MSAAPVSAVEQCVGSGKYIGRVGVLAAALGVGAIVGWMPGLASADAEGASGVGHSGPGNRGSESSGTGEPNGNDAHVPSRVGHERSTVDGDEGSETFESSRVELRATKIPSMAVRLPAAEAEVTAISGISHAAPGVDVATVLMPETRTAVVREVAPLLTAAPSAAAPQAKAIVSGVGGKLLGWLGFGEHAGIDVEGDPSSAPAMWAALSVARREFAPKTEGSAGDATVATGAVDPEAPHLKDTGDGVFTSAASVPASVSIGSATPPMWGFFNYLFGNGTAEHPDGGILIGNGYSWTAQTCTGDAVCDGGDGGIFGSGGDGFNGGDGGAAGWFGHGGDGGAGRQGETGGHGGIGGLYIGNGGTGGAGGAAISTAVAGGRGGAGGDVGARSIWGYGGDGGHGGHGADGDAGEDGIGPGANGGDGTAGGKGGQGGNGGDGSWFIGAGGIGGVGGVGGRGGAGGVGTDGADATTAGGTGGDAGSGGGGGTGGSGGVGGAGGHGRALFIFNRPGWNGNGGGRRPGRQRRPAGRWR